MIAKSSRVLNTIDELHALPQEFHLTGSKFFLGLGQDTDYFVEYSTELYDTLRTKLGFRALSNSVYADTNCAAVVRKHDVYVGQIDVQLVYDVSLKLRVQDKFKDVGVTHPTKEEWNLAFLLLA